jgi:hypothetical protein
MSNKKRTIAKELTTSMSDVYVVPPSFKADVSSIVVANNTTAPIRATIKWNDGVVSYVLFGDVSVGPNTTIQMTQPLFLDKNQKIEAIASVGSAITVSVRVEEIFAERL